MLPKNERLKKKKDFERVFKQKRSVATPTIIVYVSPLQADTEIKYPKTGFIVAKKVHKQSTKRNKIKRRMREAYRNLKKTNPELMTNFDSIIFIARPSIQEQSYTQISQSIVKCLEKANKLAKKKVC